jgi:hypothetical protein
MINNIKVNIYNRIKKVTKVDLFYYTMFAVTLGFLYITLIYSN